MISSEWIVAKAPNHPSDRKSADLAVRAVVQRVAEARVSVGDEVVGRIDEGLCVFLGVARGDNEKNADALAEKLKNLRIFEDPQGKMNLSITDSGGAILVISQFTLYADCRRGKRPSFTDAAPPDQADRLYQYFTERLRGLGLKIATGRFQTHMKVALINDGPATFILENES